MIDGVAKESLLKGLQWSRDALVWKLDGLSEYDMRRPLTATGTNLLGLVKHVATWEARYLGEVFRRPFPDALPRWEDEDGSDLSATPDESTEEIVDFYGRVQQHSNETIRRLPLDAVGQVPWWSDAEVTLFAVTVHVLNDTTRHAGHADILREQIDGQTGARAGRHEEVDTLAREAHWAKVDQAARRAAALSTPPDPRSRA